MQLFFTFFVDEHIHYVGSIIIPILSILLVVLGEIVDQIHDVLIFLRHFVLLFVLLLYLFNLCIFIWVRLSIPVLILLMNLLDCLQVNLFKFVDRQIQQFLEYITAKLYNLLLILALEWPQHQLLTHIFGHLI